jgi:hypothetical protein
MARRASKKCCECDRNVSKEEVALSRKMLGRDIEHFFCVDCFAEYWECSADDLRIKIQEFREQGCALFL